MNWQNIIINYTRKARIFNKSRYSRNRQNVRIIFFLGLYINILVIYMVFSLIYGFIFQLTYNWWFFYIFLFSFFFGNTLRIYKKLIIDFPK